MKKIYIIQHVENEGPGIIEEVLESHNIEKKIIKLYEGDNLPSDINENTGLIILGGPMNVYEEREFHFLKDENEFLKSAIIKNIPILGICLGAQLISKALGVRVYKAQEKEIGWYSIQSESETYKDPLCKNLPANLEVFQWHGDTFDLPYGSVRLYHSIICPNQAFRYGTNVYGLQFHLEVSESIIKNWLSHSQEPELLDGTFNPNMILEFTREKIDLLEAHGRIFIERFINLTK